MRELTLEIQALQKLLKTVFVGVIMFLQSAYPIMSYKISCSGSLDVKVIRSKMKEL